MMHTLPLFVRLENRPVILIGTGEAADAKRRLLERAGARIVGEGEPAAIAIVALADEAEAAAVAGRLKARGVLVNVVDRSALCDFLLPAIIDRDPVIVAIGTGGASAGLAAALRQRLEALLPSGLGRIAEAVGAARPALTATWPDPPARRVALAEAFAAGGPLDLLADHEPAEVSTWASKRGPLREDQLIALKLLGPDPDDLTFRMARWLAGADRVFHRPEVPKALLDRARADAPRIACDAPPRDPGRGLSIDVAFA